MLALLFLMNIAPTGHILAHIPQPLQSPVRIGFASLWMSCFVLTDTPPIPRFLIAPPNPEHIWPLTWLNTRIPSASANCLQTSASRCFVLTFTESSEIITGQSIDFSVNPCSAAVFRYFSAVLLPPAYMTGLSKDRK